MLSFNSSIGTLETLPDEILLLVCRYLSSSDVLFSFYGLNFRLSQTISGYCSHVILGQVPFTQFNYICTAIVPKIGANISSLVLSNKWKGILSKIFLNHFNEKMSVIFPRLKYLTLISFTIGLLMSFLDCLENLTELYEIILRGLYWQSSYSEKAQPLLYRILSANNNRLNSIMFDDDSTAFFMENTNKNVCYSNIEKLHIDVKTVNDLHELLTILPQLRSIQVTVNEQSFDFDTQRQYNSILSLKYFHLQSFESSWSMEEFISILKRIPNVEELSIAIESFDDTGLIDGEQMFSHLSILPLKKFNFFLRFYVSSVIDHTKVVSTWQQFNQEFVCIKSDEDDSFVLYTLPFVFPYLILQYPLAKNNIFIDSYAPQVRFLTLFEVSTRIAETFPIIKKCHQIYNLALRVDENVVPRSLQQTNLCKLRYLNTLSVLKTSPVDTGDFQKLIEISPNLYCLAINCEPLQLLLNNEPICHLLRFRITHLYIYITSSTSVEWLISSISHLASIFPSLKYLFFRPENDYQLVELLIVTVLNHLSKWTSLIAFCVADITMNHEIVSKGVREWVLENSSLNDHGSFVTDYFEERFRLWL